MGDKHACYSNTIFNFKNFNAYKPRKHIFRLYILYFDWQFQLKCNFFPQRLLSLFDLIFLTDFAVDITHSNIDLFLI